MSIEPHSPGFSHIHMSIPSLSLLKTLFLYISISFWSFLNVHHHPCSRGKWSLWVLGLQLPFSYSQTYISSLNFSFMSPNCLYIVYTLPPLACLRDFTHHMLNFNSLPFITNLPFLQCSLPQSMITLSIVQSIIFSSLTPHH